MDRLVPIPVLPGQPPKELSQTQRINPCLFGGLRSPRIAGVQPVSHVLWFFVSDNVVEHKHSVDKPASELCVYCDGAHRLSVGIA